MIIPAWNAADVLGACLDSLATQELPGGFETIVVNDASTDDTAELLRGYGESIRVITRAENSGFSVINNDAARDARGGVLFFLNTDTELLAPEALRRVVEVAERPDVGIAGPLLLNPDGSLQPSCVAHPTVAGSLLLATGTWRLLPDDARRRLLPEFWSHSSASDTGCVKGAAFAIRADVFEEVGGFWPTMYGEEHDLAFRVQQRGYRVRFEPSARVMHIGNHSLQQRWSDVARAEVVADAEIAFLAGHYPRGRALAIRAIRIAGWYARALAHSALGRPVRAAVNRRLAQVYMAGAARG